jgi:hypothetical protein
MLLGLQEVLVVLQEVMLHKALDWESAQEPLKVIMLVLLVLELEQAPQMQLELQEVVLHKVQELG